MESVIGMSGPRNRSGFTLLELVVVVAILVVLAEVVIPLVAGIRENSASVATTANLQAMRAAIVGGDGRLGYLSDMGQLPGSVRDIFVMPAGAATFNPLTGRGWRGPYMMDATGTYQINVGQGFTSAYGAAGDPAVLDAWGQPIVIQAPTNAPDSNTQQQFTRLVSAGPDGIIQTPPGQLYPTPSQRGDDVLLFLMRADTAP